jgi:hypothetical protein
MLKIERRGNTFKVALYFLFSKHIARVLYSERFEVFAVVTMKSAVIGDVTPCVSSKNGRFGGTYRLDHQDDRNRRARNNVSRN